jgi:hypothetical protein
MTNQRRTMRLLTHYQITTTKQNKTKLKKERKNRREEDRDV